jgi:DNA-3-methyladenine glycosylase
VRAEIMTAGGSGELAPWVSSPASSADGGPAGPEPLPREFFARPSLQVAPELLGCMLWHDSDEGLVAAVITEVEAYEGLDDPASHAYRGKTARNAVMFGPPGYAYVYFSYGMHFCVNLVCQPEGRASAVLLRAGRVTEGQELATARRSGSRAAAMPARDLARGPGRLCQALAIGRELNGADVCGGSPLGAGRPLDWAPPGPDGIGTGPRVGISRAQDWPWRFWVAGDRHVTPHKPAKPRSARGKPNGDRHGRDGTMQR